MLNDVKPTNLNKNALLNEDYIMGCCVLIFMILPQSILYRWGLQVKLLEIHKLYFPFLSGSTSGLIEIIGRPNTKYNRWRLKMH